MEKKITELDHTKLRKDKLNSNKWGKHLDDYKNYVKEYIKHFKKAEKGNDTSLAIYPYMRVRWEALNYRLTSASKMNLLTEKQIKKVNKIQSKIENSHPE